MIGSERLREAAQEPLFLAGTTKEYLWGTEEWVLSCHEMGPSLIRNEGFEGMSLKEYAWSDKEFPLLIKLIDAREALSVQVHPGDNYAFAKEGCQGKTEMWYILDHEPGACLYYGLKYKVTENEIRMLPMGAKMMTLECGIRFLTDYLQGDTYFKTHWEGQNLVRCRTQFKLVKDMEDKWEQMAAIVAKYA